MVLLNVLLLFVGEWYEKRCVIGLIENEICCAAAYTLYRQVTEAVVAVIGVMLLVGCVSDHQVKVRRPKYPGGGAEGAGWRCWEASKCHSPAQTPK